MTVTRVQVPVEFFVEYDDSEPCPRCGEHAVWITKVYDPKTGPS